MYCEKKKKKQTVSVVVVDSFEQLVLSSWLSSR